MAYCQQYIHPMADNGLDYARLRATWCCRQACARSEKSTPAAAECPFRDPARPLGIVKHVGLAFTHPALFLSLSPIHCAPPRNGGAQ